MPDNSRQGKRNARSLLRFLKLRISPRKREETEVETDSYFCQLCLAALDGRLPVSHQYRDQKIIYFDCEHYQDFDSWRNAANDGCYFCALLFRRPMSDFTDPSRLFTSEKDITFAKDFSGLSVHFQWSVFDHIQGKMEPAHRNIEISFTLRYSTNRYSMLFHLEALQDCERAQRDRIVGDAGAGLTCQKVTPSGIPTEEAWSCARYWIERCTTSHIRCSALQDKTWHPSRLLDIQDALHKVCLVETHRCGVSGPYATLSHRWPLDFQTALILCPDTYELFCQGVPIIDLPQAVQDSITCCRNLSIRYLWVDCMCIIQNPENPIDWRKQASVMDKVYTYSHVNLSAITADNTESSMFQPRDAQSFDGRVTASIAEKLGHSKRPRRYRVINAELWEQNVTRSHINARAWILQERVLSPRILHFGFGQLFWECCMDSATEKHPTGLPPSVRISVGNVGLKNLEAGPYAQGAYDIWARIVGKYSKCGLTKSSDKLVALSGLAKRVSSIVDDAYVAGMWQRYLPIQLFWSSSSQIERRTTRSAQYRAPSFSWAAIDEEIDMPRLPNFDLALAPEIVAVHLHYQTEDVFGAITGGHLMVRSYLYRVLSSPTPPDISDPYNRDMAIQILRLDGYDKDGAALESVMCQDSAAQGSFDEKLDDIDAYFKDDLYCIPRSTGTIHVFQLLLLQLVDREQAHYARRGVVNVVESSKVEPGTLLNKLQAPSSDLSLHYPCVAYEEGKHTIRLV